MAFKDSILFLSAFGKQVNKPVAGGAVNNLFSEYGEGGNPIIAPWTSGTPLSGELLQYSLDALLQNDINLLSAYPDSYLKTTYNGNSTNVQKFMYTPAGEKQTVVSGNSEDAWKNSVMVSALVGTVGAVDTSAIMLGSLVPSYPFEQGKAWNYGVFGVDKGKPTWFDVDIQRLANGGEGKITYYPIAETWSTCDGAKGVMKVANLLSGTFHKGELVEINVESDGFVVKMDDGGGWMPAAGGELNLEQSYPVVNIYEKNYKNEDNTHPNITTIKNISRVTITSIPTGECKANINYTFYVKNDCVVSATRLDCKSALVREGGAHKDWANRIVNTTSVGGTSFNTDVPLTKTSVKIEKISDADVKEKTKDTNGTIVIS